MPCYDTLFIKRFFHNFPQRYPQVVCMVSTNSTHEKNWVSCLEVIGQDKDIAVTDFDTWLKPLQCYVQEGKCYLFAPNTFVKERVTANYLPKIQAFFGMPLIFEVGEPHNNNNSSDSNPGNSSHTREVKFQSNLNPAFSFKDFVEGKSNQFAKAAAIQVSENFGQSDNPLFLYGPVGLGKTHLMQAVGNRMLEKNANLNVLYLNSERFVAEMIRSLQTNTITDFKNKYHKLDALLIDDIQFFAGKDRSQEELFHVFNSLLESGRQMIFTCDKYPKEINGLEERLKSRFGWGLTVAVEPPELETRVAILLNKAERSDITLSSEVAFFIAKRVKSNVRELEGALKRVAASARFMGKPIDLDLARETLKDLIALQDRLVTIDNIQKVVADFFKIKISDLLSKRRTRSVTRPRQIAMALAKELTNHSLPEIGHAFGGRDHTTVLHANRLIIALKESSSSMAEDYRQLMQLLST